LRLRVEKLHGYFRRVILARWASYEDLARRRHQRLPLALPFVAAGGASAL
jgi:hypothetical protein